MGFTLELHARSISPQQFVRFSLTITQMLLSESCCAELMTQLHRLKIKVTIQGHAFYHWIWCPLLNPLNDFIKLKQNVNLSVTISRTYADPRSKSQLKVNRFTLEFGSAPYLMLPLNDFIKFHLNVSLIELVCRIHDSAMQTQSQGHTSRSWNSVVGNMAVLQTAALSHLFFFAST